MKLFKNIFIILIFIIPLFYTYNAKALSTDDIKEGNYTKTLSSSEIIVGKNIEKGFYDIIIEENSSVFHNDHIEYTTTTINVPLNDGDHLKIDGDITIKSLNQDEIDVSNITTSGYYLLNDFSTSDYDDSYQKSFHLSFSDCIGQIVLYNSFQRMFYDDISVLRVESFEVHQMYSSEVIYIYIPRNCSLNVEEV